MFNITLVKMCLVNTTASTMFFQSRYYPRVERNLKLGLADHSEYWNLLSVMKKREQPHAEPWNAYQPVLCVCVIIQLMNWLVYVHRSPLLVGIRTCVCHGPFTANSNWHSPLTQVGGACVFRTGGSEFCLCCLSPWHSHSLFCRAQQEPPCLQ